MIRWFLWVVAASVMLSCSSAKWTKWSQQAVDDDLYFVSSGEASRVVDIRSRNNAIQAEPEDPYEAYLQAKKGKNSGISPYDPNEAAYDRTLRRHADPFWSSPSLGMGLGMGGFFGGRNYMLFNPYFPPFWSMQPGISLGWNSFNGMSAGIGWGMGWGMNNPWGFGGMDPWMMGMYDPWMMGMYNPWMGSAWGNPWGWNNGWHQPGWGGGWPAQPGNDVGNRLATAPPRSGSRIGGSLPQQPSLFNPNPGRNGQAGGSAIAAPRNGSYDESRFQQRTATPRGNTTRDMPNGVNSRQESGRTIITESRPTQTPSRVQSEDSPGRRSNPNSQFENPNRRQTTPSRNFDQWSSPSRSQTTPSRSFESDRGSWGSPSRGGGSEATPFRGGGSGGGGSRPSGGGSPGRPR